MTGENLPGRLRFKRLTSAGRLFDEWTFDPGYTGEQWQYSVKVQVYMRESKSEGLHFWAVWDRTESITGTDIQELFSRVEETLKMRASALAGVDWEDFLEVIVSGDVKEWSRENSISIGVNNVRRGRDQKGNFWLYEKDSFSVRPFPKSRKRGEEMPRGEANDFYGSDAEISYIPATPENRAIVDSINQSFSVLRDRLSTFLSQDQIESSIKMMRSNLAALPFLENK